MNIDHCLGDLKKLKTTPGIHQQELSDSLKDGVFKDHHVAACPMSDIQSAAKKFIDSLIDNIQSRYIYFFSFDNCKMALKQ